MNLSFIRPRPRSTILALVSLSAMVISATVTVQAGHATTPLPSLTFSASATGITITGTPTSGAVNVIETSTGKLNEPSIALLRLLPGATEAEALAALSNPKIDPNSIGKFASIVFDEEAPSGQGAEAQTDLQPGNYLAVLTGESGPAGAHQGFTVASSATPIALPAAQAQEKAIDFGFRGPRTLKVGELVGWEDGGYLVHMNLAFPVKTKAAAAKLVADLKNGREKGIQKLVAGPPVSFQNPVSPGGYQQGVITARPGIYVQVCFMDTQDGRSHAQLGMERVIRIVR